MSDFPVRPDGPTAALIRSMIIRPSAIRPQVEDLCMALAREIDELREAMADEHKDRS